MKEPEMFSQEYMELGADKLLSRWMQTWLYLFQITASAAIDLPNYLPERVATHWSVQKLGQTSHI
jgi:hypothetical protein